MRWKTKVQVARPTIFQRRRAACAEPKPNVSTANQPLSKSTPPQPSRIFIHCNTLEPRGNIYPSPPARPAIHVRVTAWPRRELQRASFRLAPQPIPCFQMPRLTRATTITTAPYHGWPQCDFHARAAIMRTPSELLGKYCKLCHQRLRSAASVRG